MHQADLFHFDGNAQALRILTRLHIQDSEPGLNLTCAVLNTLVKYPTAANQVGSDGSLLRKKMGYTDEDKETYLAITGHTGARDCRHPLAFVLEAADDIAYKTADLEDSVKKGLLNLDVLLAFIDQELQSYPDKTGKAYRYAVDLFKPLAEQRQKGKELAQTVKHLDPDFYAIQNWLPFAQEWLMYCATYGFRQLHYQEIMAGDYQKDLFVGTNHAYSVTVIDKIMREFVFPNRGIVKLELAADAILSNLLQKFTIAALFHDKVYSSSNYVNIPAYQKLYSLISDNYRAAYKQSLNCFRQRHPADEEAYREYDIYLRLLLVTDYISGMTDSYAKSLYQELNGIYNSKGID